LEEDEGPGVVLSLVARVRALRTSTVNIFLKPKVEMTQNQPYGRQPRARACSADEVSSSSCLTEVSLAVTTMKGCGLAKWQQAHNRAKTFGPRFMSKGKGRI